MMPDSYQSEGGEAEAKTPRDDLRADAIHEGERRRGERIGVNTRQLSDGDFQCGERQGLRHRARWPYRMGRNEQHRRNPPEQHGRGGVSRESENGVGGLT